MANREEKRQDRKAYEKTLERNAQKEREAEHARNNARVMNRLKKRMAERNITKVKEDLTFNTNQYIKEIKWNLPKHTSMGKPTKIQSYYDRKSRSYITSLHDDNNFQIGDACFSGTKAGRDLHIKDYENQHKIKYVKEDETPVNCIGDASHMAGLDQNPPVKKKKKLRDIIRRK